MPKIISIVFILLLTFQVVAQEKGARGFRFVAKKSAQNHVEDIVRVLYPQAVEDRTGLPYDISARSDLGAVCWNLGFDHRALGADFMESRLHRAVVVDRRGQVVAKVRGGSVIAVIDCFWGR